MRKNLYFFHKYGEPNKILTILVPNYTIVWKVWTKYTLSRLMLVNGVILCHSQLAFMIRVKYYLLQLQVFYSQLYSPCCNQYVEFHWSVSVCACVYVFFVSVCVQSAGSTIYQSFSQREGKLLFQQQFGLQKRKAINEMIQYLVLKKQTGNPLTVSGWIYSQT